MKFAREKIDIFFLLLLISVTIGLPVGIWAYNDHLWKEKIPAGAREFTLTGHTQKGWILGEVKAYDIISLRVSPPLLEKPAIHVQKGDRVVLKLKSSDVVHGFSLKDFSVIVTDGIQPGKTVLVSFIADKTGTFIFSCNAICGQNHENMQGTLIVNA
ncbi:MAG: hypothetical protein ACE5DO_10105 [Desulfobacterales bacterium]